MNEGTGTNITDSSGEENHGTLYGDADEWVNGKVIVGSIYPANIIVTGLEANYTVKLYNSSLSLICNATADSDGIANMTLPSAYRSAAFEATFRVYDDNASFLYSKWFEDVHGGDTYEIHLLPVGDGEGGYSASFVLLSLVFSLLALTVYVRKRKVL